MTLRKCLDRLTGCFGGSLDGDQIAEWVDAMDGATEQECNVATARLIRTSKWMPRPADMWTEIDKIRAENVQPTPAERHEPWQEHTYRCLECRDTGLRTVWHPVAMRAAVRHVRGQMTADAMQRKLYKCVVKCTCKRGQERRLTRAQQRFEPGNYNGESYEPGELTFKPALMVEVPAVLATEQVEKLLDWAREWKDPKPANYEDGFDDWD